MYLIDKQIDKAAQDAYRDDVIKIVCKKIEYHFYYNIIDIIWVIDYRVL